MVREEHSDYKWLLVYPSTNVANAAASLVDGCAAFGVCEGFMSDGPTCFKNDELCLLSRSLRVKRHFNLPYTA